MPHPKDNIFPTEHDCDGFRWCHTPSLYALLRSADSLPEKITPFEPPEEPDTMEFTRRILENMKKRGLLVKSSTSLIAERRPENPKRLQQHSEPPLKRTKYGVIKTRRLFVEKKNSEALLASDPQDQSHPGSGPG